MSLAAYVCAHIGKSLLWYASELLLYSITEHAHLRGFTAGLIVALGLVINAVAGLAIARVWWRSPLSPARLGHVQAKAGLIAGLSLLLLFGVPWVPMPLRLGYLVLSTLPFRVSYAFCDVAQNALFGLLRWPWRDHRGASALRLIGSGLAALWVGGSCRWILHADIRTGTGLVLGMGALNMAVVWLSGSWLSRRLSEYTHVEPATMTPEGSLRSMPWPPLALIAIISLTLPAFTKFAPYLTRYGQAAPAWSAAVLCAFALGTIGVQPLAALWHWSAASRLTALGVALLMLGRLFPDMASTGNLNAAWLALAIGAAGGAAGQWSWAWYAELVRQTHGVRHAVGFAWLTAAAQLALALGCLVIGGVLEWVGGYPSGPLSWGMAAGPITCGAGCVLLAWLVHRQPLRRRRLAATA